MIDFPTLFPNLVKYIPNWMERFYPSLAQFARGEGYPCGNQGVFIPRRNKCWTHPKTGQRLKKPLTYQMYKDAKEKSQRSRTEKGRTALETREQGFRDKAREKVKGWQKNKPTADKTSQNRTLNLSDLWRQTADAAYSKNKDGVSKNLEQWRQVVKKLESGEGISKDVNLNEYEKLMDNLEKKLVLDPKDPSNVEFKKITGSIYRTLDKAIRRDPLTQEDLEKAHPNFRPIMQRMNKTFTKHNELGAKKRLSEKELDRLKNERSYNESVILNNSKQFRETSIDNNYNELKALVKRNPNDLIDVKNPVSNLPERTVSVSKRIDEINKDIRDLADDGKAQIIQEQAKKEIARLQTPIKDTENRVSSLANEIKSLRESRGEATKSEPKQTPNSTGVKGTGGKSVDQQYKDIIASSKDPKGTEEVLSSALRGGFGDFERKNYNEYSTAIKSGTVPKGMGNYYQKQVDKYKPIIDAEDFINERKKKAISGDYETEQEAGVYVLNKLKQKGYKEHEYYDSPDYEKDYGKLVGVMKSVKLPPPLSGIVPGKELKQTLTPGDKLLVKEDTYSLMSSGNTPTGYRIVDGGEVLKVNIKNVKTRVRGEYMGKPYENEPSLALDKVTHVIRDGKRYKVDDSDSSPNDLGIIEKAKPKTGSAREMAGGKKQKSRVEQMLDGYRETSDENIKKTISYLRKSAADLESDGTRLGSSIKQRKSEEFLSDAEQLENYLKKRTKKNNFNSNLKLAQFGGNNLRRLKSKLANFAKPGCCCEASKPLRRRKTKQTPRLKRRGNRYA